MRSHSFRHACRSGAQPFCCNFRHVRGEEEEGAVRRYVYKKGKAVVFGGGVMHATEPGQGRDGEPHVYLNFTFGTDGQARWAEINKTNAYQSRMIVQPDGEMVLTRLGKELPWELDADREPPQETVLERVRINSQKEIDY